MPAATACPISGVDRALASYVNSRDDTLRIRRTLSQYLTAGVRPVNPATQTLHVNHECPYNVSATSTNPPGMKGSRITYLHALRAKSQVEAKHRELQAFLEDLRERHKDENPTLPQSDHDDEPTRGHIDLLRQRRKLAALNIIQESLEKLLSAKSAGHNYDPRDRIQEALGDQPDLPAERLGQIVKSEDDQSSMFKLKQEVLEARARMDQANTVRKQARSVAQGRPNLQKQVRALERARNEIVEWIQGELAKMEEDSLFLEDASPLKRSVQENAPMDLESADARIRASYDQYTSARIHLVEAYGSSVEPLCESSKVEPNDLSNDSPESNNGVRLVRPVAKLLPHLPLLTRFAEHERSLLQQAVFLQYQLAASDRDLEETLLRLSGESHLLPAGSRDISAWGKVAKEAESETEAFVKKQLHESCQEASTISAIVDLCSLHSEVLSAV